MNTRSGLLILIAAVAAGVVGYLGVSGGDGAGDDTTADTAPGGGHPGVPDVRNASGQRVAPRPVTAREARDAAA